MAPHAAFEELFARPPEARAVAPSAVSLLGDGDDDGGWLLACTLARETVVEVAHRDDDVIEVATTSAPDGHARLGYRVGEESHSGTWLDHVMGVTTAMRTAGMPVPGMSLRIGGDVRPMVGSASRAPIAVAILRAVRTLTGSSLDDAELARLAHVVEHDFVGAPSGIGDAIACSLGRHGDALVIDTASLEVEHVALPARAELVVIDAGDADADADGRRARRAACALAAQQLGVSRLRDVDVTELARLDALPEPLRRRARHVVTENARVLAAVDAGRRGDLVALGRLLGESHRSMRDGHEVSLAIDALVECAEAEAGCHGARLCGGDAAGSVVALVDRGAAGSVARSIVDAAARGGATAARVVLPAA